MTSEGLVTAPEGITLEEAKQILAKARKRETSIVDEDFHLKGLITIKDIEKQIKYPLSAKMSRTSSLWCSCWYYSKLYWRVQSACQCKG